MARSIPTTEPTTFAAGETVDWTRTFTDYTPSEGYTLVYYFAGPDVFTITGTTDGDGYLLEIPSTTTSAKPAGTYQWRAYAETGSGASLERYEVDRGVVVLEPNFATATTDSQELFAEQMVDAIEARMSGRLTADLESYGEAGRTATLIPFDRLGVQLGIWKAKLWRLQNPSKAFPEHKVSFRAPW